MKKQLETGQKAELAKRAGVSRSYVTQILQRRFNASLSTAIRLQDASKVMGIFIPRYDWMEAQITNNVYFEPKVKND